MSENSRNAMNIVIKKHALFTFLYPWIFVAILVVNESSHIGYSLALTPDSRRYDPPSNLKGGIITSFSLGFTKRKIIIYIWVGCKGVR